MTSDDGWDREDYEPRAGEVYTLEEWRDRFPTAAEADYWRPLFESLGGVIVEVDDE